MPRVYNKHHKDYPKDAVYIGRGSPWGNPFIIEGLITRERAVRFYEVLLETQPDLVERVKKELKGKDLVCYCAPKACHGDILLRIANEDDTIQEQQERDLNGSKTTDNNSD